MARHSTLIKQLKSEACMDCGKSYPPDCMDFDHVRGKKTANISSLRTAKALEEMKKCELVCSNCHRLRTMERRLDLHVEEAMSRDDDREIDELLNSSKELNSSKALLISDVDTKTN